MLHPACFVIYWVMVTLTIYMATLPLHETSHQCKFTMRRPTTIEYIFPFTNIFAIVLYSLNNSRCWANFIIHIRERNDTCMISAYYRNHWWPQEPQVWSHTKPPRHSAELPRRWTNPARPVRTNHPWCPPWHTRPLQHTSETNARAWCIISAEASSDVIIWFHLPECRVSSLKLK